MFVSMVNCYVVCTENICIVLRKLLYYYVITDSVRILPLISVTSGAEALFNCTDRGMYNTYYICICMESYIESYNLPKRKDNFVTLLGAGRKEEGGEKGWRSEGA